jgi:hypothetical protein
MNIIIYLALSLSLILTSSPTIASKNVIIGGGAVLKEKNGEVITTGKALIFQSEIDSYITNVTNSNLPLTFKQLGSYIQTSQGITIIHSNNASKKLNEIYSKSLITYPKIVEEHKLYWKTKGELTVTQSEEYRDSMQKIKGYENNYNQLMEIAGNEIEHSLKLTQEYDGLLSQLIEIDNRAVTEINTIIQKKYPNQRLFSAKKQANVALRYRFKPPHKKTGECKGSNNFIFIKKTSLGNNCVYWNFRFSRDIKNDKINDIAKKSFNSYYTISTKLYGSYTYGKLQRNSGLKFKVRKAKEDAKNAERKYHKVAKDNTATWLVIQNYNRIPSTKAMWNNYISKVKNKPFNIEDSKEYDYQIKQPYIKALQQYYLAISNEILKRGLVKVVILKDYKFDIDEGKYLATFVDLKSPFYKTNYGIITEITPEHTILAQQFQSNTLSFGYSASTPNKNYVYAVILNLIGKHL